MKLVIQITKGLIRDQHTRRMSIFIVLLVALIMLFLGGTFLSACLLARPLLFIGYWVVCAWLTFCATLLALYDMIVLRVAASRERRRLREEILGKELREHE